MTVTQIGRAGNLHPGINKTIWPLIAEEAMQTRIEAQAEGGDVGGVKRDVGGVGVRMMAGTHRREHQGRKAGKDVVERMQGK